MRKHHGHTITEHQWGAPPQKVERPTAITVQPFCSGYSPDSTA